MRHRILFGALTALSLVLALGACGQAASPSAPPTAQQIFDRAEQSAMKDARVDLTGHVSGNQGVIALTMGLTGSGDVVVKPAHASHLSLTMTITSALLNGTVTEDEIQVNGKSYTKMEGNIAGLPPDTGKYDVAESPESEFSILPAGGTTNLKVVGEETIRGDTCWHLTGTETMNSSSTPVASNTAGAQTIHVTAWIREKDYYFVRVKMDGLPGFNLSPTEAGTSGTPTAASANFQVDFSNYDRGVKIAPPPADQISSASQAQATHHTVGEQVQASDAWQVTVNSVRTTSGDEYYRPKSGYTYLVLNVTLKNTASTAESTSSSDFSLKDESGQGYSEALTSFTKESPGGTVEPGGLTRGEIVYEVPTSVHHFTLGFTPELFEPGVVIWDINV